MVEKTLPFLLLFALGILLKRIKILKKEDGQVVNRLLMSVIVPATVFGAISEAVIKPEFFLLPIAGILIDTVLLFIAYGLAVLFGLRARTKGAFLVAFPTLEAGVVGYAVMEAAHGINGLSVITMYDIGNAFFLFVVIAFLASSLGKHRESFHPFTALRRFAASPIIWAFCGGILVNVFHIQIPPLVSELRSTISESLLFFISILLAAEFEMERVPLSLSALTIYLKTGIGIILGLLLSFLFHFNGIVRIGVVVAASLPPSLLTVVLAKDNDLDAQFLASLCSIALPVAIVASSLLALI